MAFLTLHKGDSGTIVPVRPDISDPLEPLSEGWVCKTAVLDSNKDILIPARTETELGDSNLNWLVQLSKEDTNSIEVVGKFTRVYWVIQVENLTLSPAYSKEKHFEIIIERSGIS